MRNINRSLRYWGFRCLMYAEGTVAFSLIILANCVLLGEWEGGAEELKGILPYDLLMAGFIMILCLAVNFFTAYFPLLLSMNVTRKAGVWGFMGCMSGVAVFTVLLEVPAVSFAFEEGVRLKVLAGMLGILLAAGGLCIFGGALIFRLKKPGIFIVLGMVAGLTATGIVIGLKVLPLLNAGGAIRGICRLIAISGAALFLAAGFFTRFLTKKAEVR